MNSQNLTNEQLVLKGLNPADNFERNYTHTVEFDEELTILRKSGINDKILQKHVEALSKFDIYGNDKGTDYSNTELPYKLPTLKY